MKPWILAARPKTLPAAVVPVWVGAMPLLVDGNVATGSWLLFASTLGSCICIQVATNLFNDAIDHKKGADTEKRLGPVRATASGLLSQRAVMIGAIVFCLLAALAAIPMISARGWPIVAIGAVSLFFAYGYTGGPFPLAYRGMGEIFVILFFGFVAVLGSYFVQTGKLGGLPIWILGLQCGLYSSVLIAINNLRDIDEDRATGKRTVAVRFGEKFAKGEIVFLCWASLGLAAVLLHQLGIELDRWIYFSPLVLPAGLICLRVWNEPPGKQYNRYLALAALQLIAFAITVTVVFDLFID